MDKETLLSIVLWIGIILFIFLFWQIRDLHEPPRTALECLSVGYYFSTALLITIEIGWNALKGQISNLDRNFFRVYLISIAAIGVAIIHHAIVTQQGWIIISMIIGTVLYLLTLRSPFIALSR